jgi:hypothetical protein
VSSGAGADQDGDGVAVLLAYDTLSLGCAVGRLAGLR